MRYTAGMARPPSKNPLDVIISFRVDKPTADALEKVVEAEKPHRLGEQFRIQEAARLLMFEALKARELYDDIEKKRAELESLPAVPAKGRRKKKPKPWKKKKPPME